MGLRGAKPGYIEWEQPHKLVLLKGWARDGYTHEEIAQCMGIHLATFYQWKNKSREISDALKVSKESADFQVEQALFNKALRGGHDGLGDTTAMIFWLKNRQPDKWRDKREIDMKAQQVFITDSVPDDSDDDQIQPE